MAEPENPKVQMARRMRAEADELAADAEKLRHAADVLLERAVREAEDARRATVTELRPNDGGGDDGA